MHTAGAQGQSRRSERAGLAYWRGLGSGRMTPAGAVVDGRVCVSGLLLPVEALPVLIVA